MGQDGDGTEADTKPMPPAAVASLYYRPVSSFPLILALSF